MNDWRLWDHTRVDDNRPSSGRQKGAHRGLNRLQADQTVKLAPSDVAHRAIMHYNFTRSFSSADQLDRRISVQFEEVATEIHDCSIFSKSTLSLPIPVY